MTVGACCRQDPPNNGGLPKPQTSSLRVCSRVSTIQDKPGKHLPYESPKLQRVRDYVKWAVTHGGVHERLVMNFDQASLVRLSRFGRLGSANTLKLVYSSVHANVDALHHRDINVKNLFYETNCPARLRAHPGPVRYGRCTSSLRPTFSVNFTTAAIPTLAPIGE